MVLFFFQQSGQHMPSLWDADKMWNMRQIESNLLFLSSKTLNASTVTDLFWNTLREISDPQPHFAVLQLHPFLLFVKTGITKEGKRKSRAFPLLFLFWLEANRFSRHETINCRKLVTDCRGQEGSRGAPFVASSAALSSVQLNSAHRLDFHLTRM